MPAIRGQEPALPQFLSFHASLTLPAAGRLAPGLAFERMLHPKPGEWPTFNGRLDGNRHSLLDQIHAGNVAGLEIARTYLLASPNLLETTPVFVVGVMSVTFANEVHALDAIHGLRIWSYSQPRTGGVMGAAARAVNRGVAVFGERVFMVTDHADLLAIDRVTGRKLWDAEMADYRQNYNATLAPLVVRGLVIPGGPGGDQGVRGFLATYDSRSGDERWRFWTAPLPGEPPPETWQGSLLPHGCGTTWLPCTYDPDLDLPYWPTGTPCPDMNGDQRLGDNLCSNSMLALRPDTRELVWDYQYTPHDSDSIRTPLLVDMTWNGDRRRLLIHANQNGPFDVLDRTDGELLLAKPFVRRLNCAERIVAQGRPVLIPGTRPTLGGTVVCPGLQGATNWLAKSFDPVTGLFFTMPSNSCHVGTKRTESRGPRGDVLRRHGQRASGQSGRVPPAGDRCHVEASCMGAKARGLDSGELVRRGIDRRGLRVLCRQPRRV